MSYYAIKGFGADECVTVPYKDNTGTEGTGPVCPSAGCGNIKALQQALNDLPGMAPTPLVVDGILGENTYNAVATAAATYSVPNHVYGVLDAPTCKVIGDAWYAKYTGQEYFNPDAGSSGSGSGTSSTVTSRLSSARRAASSRMTVAGNLRTRIPIRGGTTKQGEINADGSATESGEPGMMDKAKAWWADLPTAGKVGVVAGGVAVVGILAYFLTQPSSSGSIEIQTMKANRSMSFEFLANRRKAKKRVKKGTRVRRAAKMLARQDAAYVASVNRVLDNTKRDIGVAVTTWSKAMSVIARDYSARSRIGKAARKTKKRVIAARKYAYKMNGGR